MNPLGFLRNKTVNDITVGFIVASGFFSFISFIGYSVLPQYIKSSSYSQVTYKWQDLAIQGLTVLVALAIAWMVSLLAEK